MPGPSSRVERGRLILPIPPTQPMAQEVNNAPRPTMPPRPPTPPLPTPPTPPPPQGVDATGQDNCGRQQQRSHRPRWWRRNDAAFTNIAKMIGKLANEAYGQGRRGGRGPGRGRGQRQGQ
ncbi:uncharacterized protein [Prorops nasuta]|uniref:uncharacterized protein n=1 Tax=Prorops nasuta TaxID=863751 RepID=UPI0034CED5B8